MAELHIAGLPTSVLEVVAAKVVMSVFLTHLFLFFPNVFQQVPHLRRSCQSYKTARGLSSLVPSLKMTRSSLQQQLII